MTLQQGVFIHGFDSILYLLAWMPNCLFHRMMQSLVSNINSLALNACLSLSEAAWLQLGEPWGCCRAVGKGWIQMGCSHLCFIFCPLMFLSFWSRLEISVFNCLFSLLISLIGWYLYCLLHSLADKHTAVEAASGSTRLLASKQTSQKHICQSVSPYL